MKKKTKLKSVKPSLVFKFEEGEMWDGDEMIIHYLEDHLLDEDSRIKQKTYITVHIAKEVSQDD